MSKQELWEWAFITAAVFVLWPRYILRWQDPIWEVLAWVMLVGLVVIAVRRFRRINRAAEGDEHPPPRPPSV